MQRNASFSAAGEQAVVRAAFAILFIGIAVLAVFVASYVSPGRWVLAAELTLAGAIPLFMTIAVLFLSARRFGAVESGLPGLIGSIALVVAGMALYSVALRPSCPGLDEFEPNLVFLFAPMHLFVTSIFVSLFILGWSWRRSRPGSRRHARGTGIRL